MRVSPKFTALVDARDMHLLQEQTWGATTRGYVNNHASPRRSLHRTILGLEDAAILGDHENGFPSDCRRDNLRIGGGSENAWNRRAKRTHGGRRPASAYKGVYLLKGRWAASIMVRGRCIRLGTFPDEVAAALAYDASAREHHGEFALTNF